MYVSLCPFVHLFRIAWWPSAGKELSSWLSACAVLLNAIFIVCIPLPFGVYGRMWNLIVSVPDHCLLIYFSIKFKNNIITTALECSVVKLVEGVETLLLCKYSPLAMRLL